MTISHPHLFDEVLNIADSTQIKIMKYMREEAQKDKATNTALLKIHALEVW